MSNDEANSSRNNEFHLPKIPPGEWEMNVFLNELADEMTDKDLKKMKSLLAGISGKRVLELITDPLDLFQHLRQTTILTKDNIVLLQAMLWHTRRKDLHNKIVKFAKKRGNLIHFFAPNDTPENGYEYVQFHVGGKEKMDRHKLEELRMLVSVSLCVPLEFIIASGIEATNSIMVTFMVPEGYGHILSDLDNKDRKYLGSKGVDAIWYNGTLINCIDVESSDDNEFIKKDEEVKILLDQKSKLDQEIESLQIEVLNLRHNLQQSQQQSETIQQEAERRIATLTGVLIQQFIDSKYTPEALSLRDISLRNAVKWVSHILKKMEALGYDTNLVKSLLEANALVTSSRIRTSHGWIATQMRQTIAKLLQDMSILLYQRDKLAYFLKVGISNPVLTKNEEFFIQMVNSTTPVEVTSQTEISMSAVGDVGIPALKEVLTEIFKIFEDTLTEKERKILIQKLLPGRKNMNSFKESKLLLLEYLWLIYAIQHGPEKANFHEWMVQTLAVIKRMDLLDVWSKKSDTVIQAFIGQGEGDSLVNDTDVQKRKTKEKISNNKNQKHKKQAAVEGNIPRTSVEQINEKLQWIGEMVEKNIKMTERIALGPLHPKVVNENPNENFYDWSRILNKQFK